jgi:ATP-dependent Clp protease ATP-binding subunit ClpA
VAEFPVSLDNLISYVKTLHPAGGPLENLSDAVNVGADLDEQSDALIGHFVDQARRSGASWSQIGASMGMSKQAAQKRFVARWQAADFSRFTQRSRNVLAVSGQIATGAGAEVIGAEHLTAGLLSEPDGLAARVIHGAGLTDEQILAALQLGPAPGSAGGEGADPEALRRLRFTEAGRAAIRDALTAALKRGHNYIGTEHLLLGILNSNGDAGRLLTGLGLTVGLTERSLVEEFARIRARRRVSEPGAEEEELR